MQEYNYNESDEIIIFGIPIIDTQHANLIRITHNLGSSYQKGNETSNFRFIRAVHEMADYAQYHFNTEEKLLSLLEFPEFLEHKKEHSDFIWKISCWVKEFQEGQKLDQEDFVYFLNEWLHSHIEVSDQAFADFFMAMKQHGKLRLVLSENRRNSANSA